MLAEEHLRVAEIYRNGPRYWVGRVVRPGQELILKAVIDDAAWSSPGSDRIFRPSDQLRAEIAVTEALWHYRDDLAGMAVELVRYEAGDETWMLRELMGGQNMAAGMSPFVFRADFYEPGVSEAVSDYVEGVQRLTGQVLEVLRAAPLTSQMSLAAKMVAVDLDQPTDLLAPYTQAIRSFLLARESLHDACSGTLTHGQVFPPHIYLMQGRAGLIDWENACLNNHLHDFVALYIRGFAQPQWQRAFVERLEQRGVLQTAQDRTLWGVEVLLQAAGNLNYLYWSRYETAAEQAAAIASLRRQIEAVLRKL
jgi:hypothetical protein